MYNMHYTANIHFPDWCVQNPIQHLSIYEWSLLILLSVSILKTHSCGKLSTCCLWERHLDPRLPYVLHVHEVSVPVFDSHHPKATNRPYATVSSWQGQQTVCRAAHPKTQLSHSYMGDVEYYWCLRWTVEKKPNAWYVAERIPSSQVPRGEIAFSCASGAALRHSHLSADSCVSGRHCLNVAER